MVNIFVAVDRIFEVRNQLDPFSGKSLNGATRSAATSSEVIDARRPAMTDGSRPEVVIE